VWLSLYPLHDTTKDIIGQKHSVMRIAIYRPIILVYDGFADVEDFFVFAMLYE
jgi:hypothetical protein